MAVFCIDCIFLTTLCYFPAPGTQLSRARVVQSIPNFVIALMHGMTKSTGPSVFKVGRAHVKLSDLGIIRQSRARSKYPSVIFSQSTSSHLP